MYCIYAWINNFIWSWGACSSKTSHRAKCLKSVHINSPNKHNQHESNLSRPILTTLVFASWCVTYIYVLLRWNERQQYWQSTILKILCICNIQNVERYTKLQNTAQLCFTLSSELPTVLFWSTIFSTFNLGTGSSITWSDHESTGPWADIHRDKINKKLKKTHSATACSRFASLCSRSTFICDDLISFCFH